MAEHVGDFFTNIAKDFTPLTEADLPHKTGGPKLQVTEDQVRKRMKECKKPRGLLRGDVFPDLMVKFSDKLAGVVSEVLNTAYKQEVWPSVWKTESVTSIPKTAHPETLNEVRNISCTPVLAKIMEYFVLEELKLSLIHI